METENVLVLMHKKTTESSGLIENTRRSANNSMVRMDSQISDHGRRSSLFCEYDDPVLRLVWFSYPNSCVTSSWTNRKDNSCWKTYPGG